MTTMTNSGRVPEITLGWRLRMSLESAGISVQKIADELGYSRSTISRWLNDQDEPRPAVMAQWALLTGVDRGWLDTGKVSSPPPTPPNGPRGGTDTLANLTHRKAARARTATRPRLTDGYVAIPA